MNYIFDYIYETDVEMRYMYMLCWLCDDSNITDKKIIFERVYRSLILLKLCQFQYVSRFV